MTLSNKITFCIPSKNNLRYLKSAIHSIRENSFYENEIIVYVDSDNDGTESWLKENGVTYIINQTNIPKGIAYGYNRCIEHSKTELVCMFHADMYMAKGFDINLIKHLSTEKVVVSATRVEPPLHPKGLEKIVENFGMYPEDFQKDKFDSFCKNNIETQKDRVTYGIFAPWLIRKTDLLEIGLHDEYFHSYHEDSDIFNRMILSGVKCIQSRDSFVYHFTCRGGQFQDGIEKITSDENFHRMKNASAKNYLRKWGSWIKNDEYQHPILFPVYNITYVIQNSGIEIISILEPWCKGMIVDTPREVINDYISLEQPTTQFDLKRKIKLQSDEPIPSDVLVKFDARRVTQTSLTILQNLPLIIKDTSDIGEFEVDIFSISIKNISDRSSDFIDTQSEEYKIQLVNVPHIT